MTSTVSTTASTASTAVAKAAVSRAWQTRILIVGGTLGLLAMVALFVAGILTSTPGMTVASSSGFAALAGSLTTAFVVVRRQAAAAGAA
ncbi:hypothetical protein [Serinibacter salmoneus]|uniref:Uncharacterized protein n=1 Tax=Serinibacter salmoneus TaxID=556530 RepID=A0A2A9D262_9MICO|nr:hypothetical protein [Serinibacter salmoneus]PFG20808.1 hypothetical protein ATL40_2423 [Serinibacter salmoneus]